MKQLHVGFLGASHTHYIDFSNYVAMSPYCVIEGMWAADPEKTKTWAKKFGARAFDSYDDLLADPVIDTVVITSTPRQHEEHIIAAAKAGKAIFVEQPLAISNEAAKHIQSVLKETKVPFCLSNPIKKSPYQFAKKLIDSGLIGKVLNLRIRTLHDNSVAYENGDFPEFGYVYDKSESGGGAMNNMGCHGVKFLLWFMGMPISCTGMFSSFTKEASKNGIEENAVISYLFPGGAIGTIETGWVHPRYQCNFEVNCERGAVIGTPDGLYYRMDLKGDKWIRVMDKVLPHPADHPMTYFIEHVVNQIPMEEFQIDEAVAFTKMIQAAYQSQGHEVAL